MSRTVQIFINFLILSFLFVQSIFAQIEDFQNWNNISIEKKINKEFSFGLDQEIRLGNNAQQLNDYITVIGVQYKIKKYLKLGASYRHTLSNDNENGYINDHRWYTDLSFRYKYNRFVFGYRARYQLSYIDLSVQTSQYLRNRISINYDIPKSKIVPYANYEFYYSLNNHIQNSIDKTRYTLGLDYNLYKNVDLGAYYLLQLRRANGSKPNNRYVIGFKIGIRI